MTRTVPPARVLATASFARASAPRSAEDPHAAPRTLQARGCSRTIAMGRLELVQVLEGHTDRAWHVAWSPDGALGSKATRAPRRAPGSGGWGAALETRRASKPLDRGTNAAAIDAFRGDANAIEM